MKKYLIILLLLILVSCKDDYKNSYGVVKEKLQQSNNTYIEIRFTSGYLKGWDLDGNEDLWFISSDTVQVGDTIYFKKK